MSQEEINKAGLSNLIPYRLARRGKRPTILTVEEDERRQRWGWKKAPGSFTEEEKRRLLARVVRIMVRETFSNHFYKWGDSLYRQVKGGPIGLRAAQAIARLVMDEWLVECKARLEAGGVDILLMDKYVDVVLAILGPCPWVPGGWKGEWSGYQSGRRWTSGWAGLGNK